MSRVLLAVICVGVAACSATPTSFALAPGYDSKDAAVTAFLQALAARDISTLEQQAVTETEFLKHIWPALPASRPDVGMPAGRAWAEQSQRNATFLAQTLAQHGGRRYELVAASFGGPATAYGAFTIHPEATLDLRENGVVTEQRLFGSMIESGGRWKIYSFVVD